MIKSLLSFGVLATLAIAVYAENMFALVNNVGENFEVELTTDNGKKQTYYTRDGEFHVDAGGYVIEIEVNGEIVSAGETGTAFLPSGTEISIDFGSPSAVEFDAVGGPISL